MSEFLSHSTLSLLMTEKFLKPITDALCLRTSDLRVSISMAVTEDAFRAIVMASIPKPAVISRSEEPDESREA